MGYFRKYSYKGIGKIVYQVYMSFKMPFINAGKPKEIQKIILEVKNSNKRIYLCGISESANMGDNAQTYCTLKWLCENYSNYTIINCKSSLIMYKDILIKELRRYVNEDDIFFFQCGYNTHDLGGCEDFMHQRIIKSFPNNYIIMLPQTIFFKSEKRKKRCSEIYNNHKHFLFFVRDSISQKYAHEMFPDLPIILFPDIVTSLIGYREKRMDRSGILICRRNDIERFYDEKKYKDLKNALSHIDEVEISDTTIYTSNDKICDDLEFYVDSIISYFEKFRLVITDKLHGLIFSLVSNTPVIVLRTRDHKVTSAYDSFKSIFPDRVFFAETNDDIIKTVTSIIDHPNYDKLDNYFDKEYYTRLKGIIDSWIFGQ